MSVVRSLSISIVCVLLLQAQTPNLRSGPMVGYGQMTEVMLWVQTNTPATVHYRYWSTAEPKKKLNSIPVKTTAENSCIGKTVISGLKPGTKFEFELVVDGNVVQRNYPLRFQTQPLWQWRSDPPEFSAAFGSCAYINDEPYDRPGKPYGSDYGIFTAIAAKNPDLFIWGGDNTYLREPDWDSRSGMIYRQSHTRALNEMQPLLGSVHNYALWDDHDFGPNDADRTYRLREASLEVFQLFWANQTYGTAETPGTFGRFVWNDVEFFLLDDRYHRSPNEAPDDVEKTMFGKEQLRWLKESLSSSTSNTNINFRIIVNGNQMLNPNGEYYESLTQYRSDYNELIGYIKKNKIPGIIFLSGDRHLTEMVVVKDSLLYPLYDYTSSPLTSALTQVRRPDGTPTKEFYNPLRVEGTLVNDKHNFGMLRFSGKRNERVVSLECYDLTGAQRWAKKITAAELRAH